MHFLLHSKGVAGVAAGVVNPATPSGAAVLGCTGYGSSAYYLGSRAPAHSAGRDNVTEAEAHLELQNRRKSKKIDENQTKSTNINQNKSKSIKIDHNQ